MKKDMKTRKTIKQELESLGIVACVYKVTEEGIEWTRIHPVKDAPDFTKEQCNVIQLYLSTVSNAVSISAYYGQSDPEIFNVQPHGVSFHLKSVDEVIADEEEEYGLTEAIKSMK